MDAERQAWSRRAIVAPRCCLRLLTQYATARVGIVLVTINPAYRLAEVRYRAGTARQIELLDARAVLQGSELSLLQTRVAERVAGAALLKAAGQVRMWAGGLEG